LNPLALGFYPIFTIQGTHIGSVAIAGFGGVCYFAAFYYISAGLKVTCYYPATATSLNRYL